MLLHLCSLITIKPYNVAEFTIYYITLLFLFHSPHFIRHLLFLPYGTHTVPLTYAVQPFLRNVKNKCLIRIRKPQMKQNSHHSIQNNYWNDVPHLLLEGYVLSNNKLIAEIGNCSKDLTIKKMMTFWVCSEDSRKCLREVYSLPEIYFLSLCCNFCCLHMQIYSESRVLLHQREVYNSTGFRWHWRLTRKIIVLSDPISSANVSLTFKCFSIRSWFLSLTALLHSQCNGLILCLSGANCCQQLKGLWF